MDRGRNFCAKALCDHPNKLASPGFDGLGKTVGLLLRMLKSIFHSGRYDVLDSGFCVLKAIVELKKKGVLYCAEALIND